MEATNDRFSVIFASLEEYKSVEEYSEIANTILETQKIQEQKDLLNLGRDEPEDQVIYTRA